MTSPTKSMRSFPRSRLFLRGGSLKSLPDGYWPVGELPSKREIGYSGPRHMDTRHARMKKAAPSTRTQMTPRSFRRYSMGILKKKSARTGSPSAYLKWAYRLDQGGHGHPSLSGGSWKIAGSMPGASIQKRNAGSAPTARR